MGLDDQTPMVREKMWVVRPADTHLSDAGDGGKSALAREDGTNDLVTHATLHPIEQDEEVVVQEVHHHYGPTPDAHTNEEDDDALVALAVIVAIAIAPHAKRLWDERVFPGLKVRWEKWRTRRTIPTPAAEDDSSAVDGSSMDAAQLTEVGAAFEEYQAGMSSEEARERFAAAVAARLFSDEQLQLLLHAEIKDKTDFLEGQVNTLTSQEVGDRIAAMLDSQPELFTEALFTVRDSLGVEPVANDSASTTVQSHQPVIA